MGDFRVPFGSAIGRQNNFFARTDGLFSESDTSPDVTAGNLFYSNNTTNTSITYFDLTGPGSFSTPQVGLYEGKRITFITLDDSTSLVRSAQLLLAGTNGNLGANGVWNFIFHNSSWIETGRSENGSSILSMNSSQTVANVVGNVNYIRLVTLSGTSTTLKTAINGFQGQRLYVTAVGASDALIIVNSAANNTFVTMASASATQITLASSSTILFVREGQRWNQVSDLY